jgi:predicted CxxxxCH...CXXCH cytochrome family protein
MPTLFPFPSRVVAVVLFSSAAALGACGKARSLVNNETACASCHGDPDRVPDLGADVDVRAAPPLDVLGNSVGSAVGAHLAHVNPGAGGLAQPLACAECHVVPADLLHASGGLPVVTLGRLSHTGGASPTWNPANLSCSATYCHGSFALGLDATPTWVNPASGQCGTCHGIPPTQGGHTSSTACGSCHPGYTATAVNRALHVNGTLDVSGGGSSCTSCHGTPGRVAVAGADPLVAAAPPVDTQGLQTGDAVGAHLAHVDKTAGIMSPAQCVECHSGAVPSGTTSHPSGTVTVAFSGRATKGRTPGYAPLSLTCSATYCHGGFTNGTSASPKWTDAPTSCGSCHGNPPTTGGTRAGHGRHPGGNRCGICHSGADSNSDGSSPRITNASLHVNGAINVVGDGTWNSPTTCSASCHD